MNFVICTLGFNDMFKFGKNSSRWFLNSNDGEMLFAGINERDIAGGGKQGLICLCDAHFSG